MGGSPKRSSVGRDIMQVAEGGCLPMCLCVWNNFSVEKDKDLKQGSSERGWLKQGFWWGGQKSCSN